MGTVTIIGDAIVNVGNLFKKDLVGPVTFGRRNSLNEENCVLREDFIGM